MRARLVVYRALFCLAAAPLAACGGGGGGGGAALPPVQAQASGGTTGTSSAAVPVSISIAIPTVTSSSAKRSTRYVSAGTKSASVSYSGSVQTTNCDATCTLSLNVKPGTITFAIGLFDQPNAGGHLLSSGQTTATVTSGTSNSIKLTFGAVVASVAVSLGTSSVTSGTPATIPVNVTAKDAAGYTIVGTDPFAAPISLAVDDTSGAFALSSSTVSTPGAAVNLVYNGQAAPSVVHLQASGAGTPATAALNVQSAPVTAPPNGPAHVTTWYYYGLNDMNSSVSAAWMAAHADYAEGDAANSVALLQSFKSAGGKYAVSYTDPTFSAYCRAPFAPPAGSCEGPMGSLLTTDESAWLHASDGTRVHRFMSDHFQYQDAMNPASPDVRDAYHRSTAASLAADPQLDYFFADDSGGVFDGSDGTQLSGLLYNFSAPSTEITDTATFVDAEKQVLATPARPVFINGATPYTLMPSYDGAFLKSSNVAGQNFEGCYGDYSGLVGDDSAGGPRWTNMSNALLAAAAYGSKAVCMNVAAATPANRMYVLASWWMAYDPVHSIIAPMSATPDGLAVLPELDIVPSQPRATAAGSIASLRSAGGAYLREFAACYQAGASIGPCAAVVNPGAAPVPMPPTAGRYAAALALDDRSAYTGGKAAWTAAIPAQIAPQSAVVVR